MPGRQKGRAAKRPPRKSGATPHPTHVLSPRGRRALERVRAFCLSLPDATEKEAWGAPTFRVRDKLFCHFREDHHGDGRIAVWCKAPPGEQAEWVEAEPSVFFVPPYVGPSGWVGADLERADWQTVQELLETGYRMNAAKRQLAQLDALREGTPR